MGRVVACAALISALLPLAACGPDHPPPDPVQHALAVEEWRTERHESLMQPDGWLSLVGLFWLREGEQTFGAAPENDLVYAGAPDVEFPDRIGTFTRDGMTVRFDAAPGVPVTADGEPVSFALLTAEPGQEPLELALGSLRWFLIRRGERMAIRAMDARSPVRTEFQGVETFPVTTGWSLPARFEFHDPPDTIQVPNILGTTSPTAIPATVHFDVDGTEYALSLWKDSDDPANFFTAFADSTNGSSTYGGGRFLWVDAPDETGWSRVDFNRSYNPPCVFTEFATCPLPPRENRLALSIPAGERVWGKDGGG